MFFVYFFRWFPSFLTCTRIFSIPFLVRCLAYKEYWWASFLFAYAGLTDYLDGFLARKWRVTSQAGAILDVIADKCSMLGATIGLLLYAPIISMRWFLYAVLIRELHMILGAFMLLITKSKYSTESLYIGKINMAFQFVLITFILASAALQNPIAGMSMILFFLGFCSMLISLIFYALRLFSTCSK